MGGNVSGKSIIITGAASGFGRLVAQKTAALGARVTCGDINLEAVEAVVAEIRAAGGSAQAVRTDVTKMADMRSLAQSAVEAYGAIDVMMNNAGTMPLAFFADHEIALEAWDRCIDINFKGVMHGTIAVFDQMMAQGRGHVINMSSIYGNHPVIGAAVYGATKSAVNFLSESLRVEGRGKIKVTVIRPTGVPVTGLNATIVNQAAGIGILAHNMGEFTDMVMGLQDGTFPAERLDQDNIDYASLAPEHIADAIIHAIDQPWGVSIAEVTVRAAGDYFIL
ncbi:SDR family oxidoreductase [Altererythrobacter sp. Root672]|uniref:SDR family oxidoreductase n=1 Tax=Altererythrobacter sp. Root672 TaxID=1736584 RepID=UPI0006F60C17|nr:SDR family oxidoreductase [Altererythrobacter sp. Root672]KRA79762.1 short-chain dehydrogenase [Altererythrobacter sp. Root672]